MRLKTSQVAYYFLLSFEYFIPYFHIQTAHIANIANSLLPNLTLDWLKNEVVEQ